MQEGSMTQGSRLLYIFGFPGTWLVVYILFSPLLTCISNDSTKMLLLLDLFIAGLQIAAMVLIFRSKDLKRTYIKLTCMFAGAALAFLATYLYYIAVPGYIVPFFNNPVVQVVLPSLMAWQVIGMRFLSRCSSFWKWVVLFIVFMLPLTLIMRIGSCVLWQTKMSASAIAEIMARPGFSDLWKIDVLVIAVSIAVTCLSYPGLWSKLLRLENKAAIST
jgi:hypothetical protein